MPKLPVEIAFLAAHGVAWETLHQAAAIAERTGVSADAALLRCDLLPEDRFYRALAAEAGLPFLPTIEADEHARYPHSILQGVVSLRSRGQVRCFAVAPTGAGIRRLLDAPPAGARPIAVTTPSALRRAVLEARAAAIAERAANELAAAPDRSIRDGATMAQRLALVAAVGILSFAGVLAPVPVAAGLGLIMATVFLSMVLIRLAAARERVPVSPPDPPRRWDDRRLPVYTIIVALHREGRVIGRLIEALLRLDYPRAKLDIKFVIEADDRETRAALAARRLPGCIEVIVAPPGLPRTKPRALNVALPLARGDYTVVFDAEDVPDPEQLRLAVAMFARAAPDVACLQARLVIDNTHDSWLTRFFTIEYATTFDVINPALAAFNVPLPLGGTSNHFRTGVLSALRGWDAWNVTEDADLGMRLALAGFRCEDLPSATLEEAPATGRAWLRQRTRWLKGFMQVCISHSREPWQAVRTLGPARFLGAVAMTLGTVATALGYPIFVVLSALAAADGSLFEARHPAEAFWLGLSITLLVSGLISVIVPPAVALHRRGWLHLLPWVGLVPFYYALVSVAAWRSCC